MFWQYWISGRGRVIYFEETSGGAIVSGSSEGNLVGTGGVHCSGSSAPTVIYTLMAEGGVETEGDVDETVTFLHIYNSVVPKNPAFPFVVFNFRTTSHSQYLGKSKGVADSLIDFTIVGRTHLETLDYGNRLENALSGFSGSMGLTAVHNSEMSEHDDEVIQSNTGKLHQKTITYQVQYEEPAPPLTFVRGTTVGEFEESLVDYLSPVARIYMGQLSALPVLPAIVFRRIEGEDKSYLNSVVNFDRAYEFVIIADRWLDALNLSLLMRNKMDGLWGELDDANIMECSLETERQDVEYYVGDKAFRTIQQIYQISISPA